MSTLIRNVRDCFDAYDPANEGMHVPGVGVVRTTGPSASGGSSRFLGDPETGPWVYHLTKPAGARIPTHKHQANRVEFVIDGRIRWHEPGKEAVEYGTGTMSYVTAGTLYGYDVLEDATILILFEKPPGVHYA